MENIKHREQHKFKRIHIIHIKDPLNSCINSLHIVINIEEKKLFPLTNTKGVLRFVKYITKPSIRKIIQIIEVFANI